LFVFGDNDSGQLGTGTREPELRPVPLTLVSDNVVDVACGIFHTLILTDKGRVYSSGGNNYGQLGVGNKKPTNIPTKIKEFELNKVVKVACGHHSAALTEKGEIYIWGTGVFGEYLTPLKFSQSGHNYKDISVGGFFGSAIDEKGLVWTWGSNTSGELGLGDFEPRIYPFPNVFL
jgi:alpha-tubulin suppressor-like RCC1 family protein